MTKHKKFYDNLYTNPFIKGHANPKHAWSQVNGETMEPLNTFILHRQTRKQS